MTGRRAVLAVLAAAITGTAACGGVAGDKAGGEPDAEPVVLTLAHTGGEAPLRPFVDEVARASGERVRIEPYEVSHRATTDGEAEVIAEVQAGRADLGITRRRDPTQAEELLVGARTSDLVVVGLLPGPPVRPAGTKRALLGPADYGGTRIAVRAGDPATASLTALGATTALHDLRGSDIGRVDALAAPVSAIADEAYDGAATTLTTNVVLGTPQLVIFGRPGPHTAVLRAAAVAAISASAELRRAEERTAMARLCRRGKIEFVAASEADLQALQKRLNRDPRPGAVGADLLACADGTDRAPGSTAVDGVYEITTDRGTSRLTLDRGLVIGDSARGSYAVHGTVLKLTYPVGTRQMVYRWNLSPAGELTLYLVAGKNSPEPLRSRPWRRIGEPPVAEPTPADGVYEAVIDGRRYRWTLGRGQFSQSREGEDIWASGSYRVSGDVLTAIYTQTGGGDLAAGQVKTGDTIAYRWNVYRGRLHLSPVDGANSPAIFSAVDWRRVGDAP